MKSRRVFASLTLAASMIFNTAIAEVIPFDLKKIEFGGSYIHFDCTYGSITEKCMFDSGSDSTFIKLDSRTSDLPKIRDAKFTGASGVIKNCDVVSLDSFSIGPFAQKKDAVRCNDKPTVVGIDAFSKNSFSIDFTKNTLETGAFLSSTGHENLIVLPNGHLKISAELNSNSLGVIWDTGAGITVVDLDFALQHPESFVYVQELAGTDATNSPITMKIYNMKNLKIGGHAIPESLVLSMSFQGLADYFGKDTHLVLGPSHMTSFKWCFDIPNKRWSATP